jgi:cell fate regulator YaaT (PSP1 superfamily)
LLIEVAFGGNRKEFFRWEQPEAPPLNAYVIVDADRGEDLGRVHAIGDLALKRSMGCSHGCGSEPPERHALRLATKRDVKQGQALARANADARRRSMEKVQAAGLAMKISDAEWQWDKKKLTLYFTADKRVDFRNLVRELASTFRTRIELKQIGVRDEAKRLDGIGRCGRQYCSASWLPELRPVNLGVAKDQRLSLNPSQISGACGRLMCSLRFEHEFYVQSRKQFPKEGKVLVTSVGEEKVVAIDIFRETVTLRSLEGGTRVIPLVQFQDEAANRPAPVIMPSEEEPDDVQSYEISPELMYTAEFAVPEPRLVILTESIDPEEESEPANTAPAGKRRRRGRGRRGGGGRSQRDQKDGTPSSSQHRDAPADTASSTKSSSHDPSNKNV